MSALGSYWENKGNIFSPSYLKRQKCVLGNIVWSILYAVIASVIANRTSDPKYGNVDDIKEGYKCAEMRMRNESKFSASTGITLYWNF